MSSYEDKTLTCRDCGVEFVFTASEQEFFAQHGFTNEPGRCPRAARPARRGVVRAVATRPVARSAARDSQRREMFPAVCAQCGKDTQVPFQPRNDRPVYCSDCYSAQRGTSRGRY